MKRLSFVIICLFILNTTYSQKIVYGTLAVPEALKENVNSVILNQEIEISILSEKQMRIKKYKVIRVYNEEGLSNIDAIEYYDKSNKIKWLEATIYDYYGKELKKYKESDFKDQSVVDGYSVFSDDRKVYLDFTPTQYPFTLIYYSELEDSNTAFIPTWIPIDDYYESAIKSSFSIEYPSNLGFKYKEINFEGANITKKEEPNKLSYTAENVMAIKKEAYAPSLFKIIPKVEFNLQLFTLEGVEVTAANWEQYGASWYKNILADTEELPEETKQKIKALVGAEKDPIKKIKLVYEYVQNKTRYVSIQLGIGGWKPMLAKDVDRLGYGDCKALSNYTRVLLKEAGITSYLTIINGGSTKEDISPDFVRQQGNHAILTVPLNNQYYFLECTSQTDPFNYQGTHTDGRYALMITPEKGIIIRTNEPKSNKDNSKITKSSYTLNEEGDLVGSINSKSKGIQYKDYSLANLSKDKIDEHYKKDLFWINNLKLEKYKFKNDKDAIEFTEELQVSAPGYANLSGTMLLFPINAFNQFASIPQRYRNRKLPFVIERGIYDEDQIEVILPEGYKVDALPENTTITNAFGDYKTEIIVQSPQKLIYKRSLSINAGTFDKKEYDTFRNFIEQIAKNDNAKVVITKK